MDESSLTRKWYMFLKPMNSMQRCEGVACTTTHNACQHDAFVEDEQNDMSDTDNSENDSFIVSDGTVISDQEYSQNGNISTTL